MDDEKRALWTKVVADFELSGLSQRVFAEQKQIELSSLRYWMYKLRNESRPLVAEEQTAPEPGPERAERRVAKKAPRMLAVRVVASPAPKAREVEAEAGLLELVLPSGACLRFPPGTDPGYLRQLAGAF